ncbi:MAG: 4-alpha-glucanotransferase [Desulfotomaculum sp.]|nr:4-alpha-glucanotransferase [Desulfotomaculum sp.]
MYFNRASGILLHPTSLPSNYGIGDLGVGAYDFIDFLQRSKQSIWQILPLNPVGYGESPYQCFSVFAGNPMLISVDKLIEDGFITEQDLSNLPIFNQHQVQFALVKEFKEKILRKSFEFFDVFGKGITYINFIHQNKHWLEDYALFMALKEHFAGEVWNRWDKAIAFREEQAVENYKILLSREIEYHYFVQYIFFDQWAKLKKYANDNGVKIIGDLPIYVAYNSSDVWANTGLFQLDSFGNPIVVAGVPPDYFSETGQLWGNPIYDWDKMEQDDFKWWVARVTDLLKQVDMIRIDHFIGLEAYWEIEASEKTAINGQWVKAPGEKLFLALEEHLRSVPIIAEDLGLITPEVEELKNKFRFPGMKVLQFALESGAPEQFLPYYHASNLVVYTGTHDNDTILGWYQNILTAHPQVVKLLSKYFAFSTDMNEQQVCWRLIEIAFQSMANTVIIPLQDILCLDSKAKMNQPGIGNGNWTWRFTKDCLKPAAEKKLVDLTLFYNRAGK